MNFSIGIKDEMDMEKVAVFIQGYNIGKSSPVICFLDLLSDRYEVDLFLSKVSHLSATVLTKPTINIVPLDGWKGVVLRSVDRGRKLLAACGVGGKAETSSGYRAYVAFDPHAFLLCRAMFPEVTPFYYSLELYFRDNHFNLPYPPRVMEQEHSEINSIKGLLIQSEERESLFRKEYELAAEIPSFILPVTYLSPSSEGKSDLLRTKFNIPPDTKIALHLGGIREYFSCIELALAFSGLSGYALIFHGYSSGGYLEKLKAVIAGKGLTNIFISDETFELIEEMDRIVMSCDLGVAWYNDLSPNFTTSGRSSGKISAYLRFGLPVIAKKYPSTVGALEDTRCGVCVDDFDGIPDAVRRIEEDYQGYSVNCRKVYDRVYWFENYRAGLVEFMER